MRHALAVAFLCLAAALTVNAETASIPVVATDGNGSFGSALGPEHFAVTEDGKPCRVVSVRSDSEEPIWVLALVEYSRRLPTYNFNDPALIYPYQDVMFEAGMAVYGIVTRLRDDDRMALAAFGNRVNLLSDFTDNRQEIVDGVEAMLNNSVGPTDADSSTYDALAQSFRRLAPTAAKHKTAIVLIGTGQDTFGNTPLGDIEQFARASGIQLFFIRTGWQAVQNLERDQQEYRTRTGRRADPFDYSGIESTMNIWAAHIGAVARVSAGRDYIIRIATQGAGVAIDLLGWVEERHVLEYEAPEIAPDGKLHKVKVQLVGEVKFPGGRVFKGKAHTVDGRKRPKEKKK